MRIAEYKQISTQTVEEEILIPSEYDEEGNIISEEHTEIVTKEIPVMGLVYRDMTAEEEEAQMSVQPSTDEMIAELKQLLSDMDYKTSKYCDGEYSEDEWADIVAERKRIRERIRELENEC